jgi:hypothetical protein
MHRPDGRTKPTKSPQNDGAVSKFIMMDVDHAHRSSSLSQATQAALLEEMMSEKT